MGVKKINLLVGVLCVSGMMLGSEVFAQQQRQSTSETTTSQQTTTSAPDKQGKQGIPTVQGVLLFSDALIGAPVQNAQGEEIGDIQRLLINPQTGLVSYVEVSVGGFLGMGDKNVVVPWRALTASREGDSLVLNVSKKILREAPEGDATQATPPAAQEQPQPQSQGQQKQN
jgi:sporulation protein YlmC with PRC-barrel domain